MATALIYRSSLVLTRRRLAAPLLLVLLAASAGGCSIPISIPLGPMTAASEEPVTTGVEEEGAIVDNGVAERVGEEAWAALRPAVVAAIATPGTGHAMAWRSETAPVSGTVTVIEAIFDDGVTACRGLAITAKAERRTDNFGARACRAGPAWTLTPVDAAS